MPGIRADTLLTMTYFIKSFTLDRAWLGLADDELFWEPVAGAWGVRRREDCTTVEPLTTIGWLFWHVGSTPGRLADLDVLGGSKTARSGWTSPYLTPHPIFTTAGDRRVGAERDQPPRHADLHAARPLRPGRGPHVLRPSLGEQRHRVVQAHDQAADDV